MIIPSIGYYYGIFTPKTDIERIEFESKVMFISGKLRCSRCWFLPTISCMLLFARERDVTDTQHWKRLKTARLLG